MVVGEIGQRRDAERASGQRHKFGSSVGLIRGRPIEHLRRQRTFRKVVEAREVSFASPGGESSLPEKVLEYGLRVIPIPPRSFRPAPLAKVTGGEGALLGDAVEDRVDEVGPTANHLADATPAMGCSHFPAVQMMVRGRHMRGLVHPVLEEFPIGGRRGDEVAWMGAESGEEREFLAPDQHVDRVDLDKAHVVDGATQVAAVDAADRT